MVSQGANVTFDFSRRCLRRGLTLTVPSGAYEGEASDVAPLGDWHADGLGNLVCEDNVLEDDEFDADVDVPAEVDGRRTRHLHVQPICEPS